MGIRPSKLLSRAISFRRKTTKPLLAAQCSDSHNKSVKGYVPVCVGQLGGESRRFMVHTALFEDEGLLDLLCMSAEEYGFGNQGVLRIPCDADSFQRRMQVLCGEDRHRLRRGILAGVS